MGRLGSGPRLVGRIGSGVRVSVSFQQKYPPSSVLRCPTAAENVWHEKKLARRGYPLVKKIEDIFIRFVMIHERDRQTDGQTPHDGYSRAYT